MWVMGRVGDGVLCVLSYVSMIGVNGWCECGMLDMIFCYGYGV